MSEQTLTPAPLLSLPQDPAPDGMQSFWFEARDGTKLRAGFAPAAGTAKGSIVFSPGRTEYFEKYLELAREMTKQGYAFAVLDHRGQGMSARPLKDPLKGHVTNFRRYADDLEDMIAALGKRLPGPLFLAGHSMGGLIAADLARRHSIDFAGLILCAPMFGFKAGGAGMNGLIRMANALGFGKKSPPGVDGGGAQSPNAQDTLTSDAARFARDQERNAQNQDIHLGPPTFGWLKAALNLQKNMFGRTGYRTISIPVYLASAGEEALVSNSAIRKAFKQMPNAVYENIPGARHEIIQEVDAYRKRYLDGLKTVLKRAGQDEKGDAA